MEIKRNRWQPCQIYLHQPGAFVPRVQNLHDGKCTRLFDQPAHAALPPCHCSRRQRAGCLQRQRFYQLHQFFENFPQFIRHYAVRISQPAAAYAGTGSLYPIDNVSRPISSLGQLFSKGNTAVFVEIDHIFDFSDTPYGKKKDKQARKAENEVDERNGMKTSKRNTICSF